MPPGQLACPKCGCLLAQFDTDVRRECPACGHPFSAEAPVVSGAEAPQEDRVDSAAAGCGMLTFLYLLTGFVPLNLFDATLVQCGAVALVLAVYFYFTRLRRWSQNGAVRTLSVSLLVLLLASFIARIAITILLP